jgi:hypothetical protein
MLLLLVLRLLVLLHYVNAIDLCLYSIIILPLCSSSNVVQCSHVTCYTYVYDIGIIWSWILAKYCVQCGRQMPLPTSPLPYRISTPSVSRLSSLSSNGVMTSTPSTKRSSTITTPTPSTSSSSSSLSSGVSRTSGNRGNGIISPTPASVNVHRGSGTGVATPTVTSTTTSGRRSSNIGNGKGNANGNCARNSVTSTPRSSVISTNRRTSITPSANKRV